MCNYALINRFPNGKNISVITLADERSSGIEEFDFVLLEKIKNTVIGLTNYFFFSCHHLGYVNCGFIDRNTVDCSFLFNFFKQAAACEQSLGRNTSNVGASTTGSSFSVFFPFVNDTDRHSELSSTNGCYVSAGTGADNGNIKNFHFRPPTP